MVIMALASLFGVAIFPNFMLSTIDPAYSVTLENDRSSQGTLQTMLAIIVIGMPCVLSYTVIIDWIF